MIPLPGGALTWAELFSKSAGLLKPSAVPPANASASDGGGGDGGGGSGNNGSGGSVSASELVGLQTRLPKFLESRDADGVNNLFKTLKEETGAPALRPGLRPRDEAPTAAPITPSAAQVGTSIQQAVGSESAPPT